MIAIVDYGMGNLRSVQKAFERVGHAAVVTGHRADVTQAERIVLPGVGAFGDAMANLQHADLIGPILSAISKGVPFLGICLGLQLLFTQSEEMGRHRGLDVLPGQVRRFPQGERVPHIGWNQVHIRRQMPLLDGIPDGAFFYFVHSYYVEPRDPSDTAATTDHGIEFASIAAQGNTLGIQFHPEKSQDMGLQVLKNFAELEY